MKKLNDLTTKAYVKVNNMKDNAINSVKEFMAEERGASDILSMMIILGVVVAIAFLFRKSLISLVQNLWANVFGTGELDADKVTPAWGE